MIWIITCLNWGSFSHLLNTDIAWHNTFMTEPRARSCDISILVDHGTLTPLIRSLYDYNQQKIFFYYPYTSLKNSFYSGKSCRLDPVFQVKISPKRNTAMLERQPICNFVPRSAITKGYICVGNRKFRLVVYKDLNLGARPPLKEGFTARMTTLNLESSAGNPERTFTGD